MKASQAKKAPEPFLQTIPRRRFERVILRRVYLTSEREFLLGLYRLGAQGAYQRPAELSGEQLKRLLTLAKSIKANRGVVQTGKAVILGVLVAALLVFSLVFKNRLVEGLVERALEGVFSAEAEVSGLDLRLLDGSLTFSRLEVADSEAPMTNLFELGWSQVSLDTSALLKRRFVLDNMETRDLAWNTPRRTSGALEAPPERQAEEEGSGKGKAAAQTLGRAVSTVAGRLDVQALLAEEAGALQSPARVEAANREIQAATTRWRERVTRGGQDVEALSGQVDALRRTDVKAIRTLPEAQALAAQLREVIPALRRLQEDLAEVDRGLEGDMTDVEGLRREVREAMDADVDFLRSRLDLSGGGLRNLASSLASGALEQVLGRIYGYVRRGVEYGRALAQRKREKRKEGPLRRAGRVVAFPSEALPRFLLRRMAVSLSEGAGSGGGRTRVAGVLRDVSSDPDLLDRPVGFSFSQESGARLIAAEGFLDTRTARSENAGLDLRAENLPFSLSEGLESLGLAGVNGSLRLRTALVLGRDGRMSGQGRLELPELSLLAAAPAEGTDLLATTIAETVGGLSTGAIDFRYQVVPGGEIELELTSNLDALLARRLSDKLAALDSEYGARVRGALEEQLREALGENEQLYGVLEDLEAAAGGNLAEADSYREVVAAKQRELEGKLAELQQKATEGLRKEAEKQLEEVTDQLKLPDITF